jgi:hypothetical protein
MLGDNGDIQVDAGALKGAYGILLKFGGRLWISREALADVRQALPVGKVPRSGAQ